MMKDGYLFHDGTTLGTPEQIEACEHFMAALMSARTNADLPYLVGSNSVPADLAAAMVSAVAIVTSINQRTGGVPADNVALLADSERGVVGMIHTPIEHVTPDEWNPLACYLHSRNIMQTAEDAGATHVLMTSLVMLDMTSRDGGQATDGPSPMIRIVGWDIKRNFGIRWFARVASTGNSRKPFHLIPWDKKDTAARYDWSERITALGQDAAISEDEMGNYFMDVLKPGIETVNAFDEYETIVPIPKAIDVMRERLESGTYGDIDSMVVEAAEQFVDEPCQLSLLDLDHVHEPI
jgi:hypothetical protein